MSTATERIAENLQREYERQAGVRWQDLPPTFLPDRRPRRPLDVRIRQALLQHMRAVYVVLVALLALGLGLVTDWSTARALAGWLVG